MSEPSYAARRKSIKQQNVLDAGEGLYERSRYVVACHGPQRFHAAHVERAGHPDGKQEGPGCASASSRAPVPPASPEGGEQKLFQDALEQVELADRLGVDHAWEVERRAPEEHARASFGAEVFLAAASQRTQQIRLSHGIVLLPPN
ncbi:MAG: LLM class flavin-dependent oxidoreductase [Dehalococcoidia bacterium]|nr:LLM class flavin-dependent oxidoreductase [Dehalococcoidia bacterium]